jgi:hypothetical protein
VQEHGSKGHRGIGFLTFQSAGMYIGVFRYHFGGKRLSCWGAGSELKWKWNDWMTLWCSNLFYVAITCQHITYRENARE